MICLQYPTIMDGLVLRWYLDQAGYDAGNEVASASAGDRETRAR